MQLTRKTFKIQKSVFNDTFRDNPSCNGVMLQVVNFLHCSMRCCRVSFTHEAGGHSVMPFLATMARLLCWFYGLRVERRTGK